MVYTEFLREAPDDTPWIYDVRAEFYVRKYHQEGLESAVARGFGRFQGYHGLVLPFDDFISYEIDAASKNAYGILTLNDIMDHYMYRPGPTPDVALVNSRQALAKYMGETLHPNPEA